VGVVLFSVCEGDSALSVFPTLVGVVRPRLTGSINECTRLPHASGGGPIHTLIGCGWEKVFPTLVGVVPHVQTRVILVHSVFPTLVGVVRIERGVVVR